MTAKQGLGHIEHAGRTMVWGKGTTAGGFVFLSGTDGRRPQTDLVAGGIEAQTELCLEKVKERLEEAGARLEDVVRFGWYVTDPSLTEQFKEARDRWLERNAPSLLHERSYASTLIVAGLARADMLVEIDCIAYVVEPEER
jgi:2-iminobutanoate/2-iminopropanoate deaminase